MEIILTNNAMFYTFPMLLIAIPIGVSIYSMLTFLPKWIAEKKISKNKWKIILMVIVWVFVSVMTYATNIRGV